MKKTLLICGALLAVLLLVGLLTWPLPRILAEGLASWADVALGHTELLKTLGVASVIITAFVLALVLFIPILIYVFKKIFFYVSVFFLCLSRRYRFRVTRCPFASLRGASDTGDVEITTNEGILRLHFIDVVFPYRRALTIPNPQEYVITPTSKGRIVREGGGSSLPHMQGGRTVFFRAKNRTLDKNRDRVRKLPAAVSEANTVRQLIVMHTIPGECHYIQNGASLPLSAGITIRHLTFMTEKYLKRGLKGQLHAPLSRESDAR